MKRLMRLQKTLQKKEEERQTTGARLRTSKQSYRKPDQQNSWHGISSEVKKEKLQFRDSTYHQQKSSINPTLSEALKKYAMRFYQLKIGHGAVGTFLARIGVMETPECWWCRTQEQTVIRLYTECRRWRRERSKLSRELGQLGIRWQPRPERRWLGNQLANKRAVRPILQFLKDMEVGSRDETREWELEWQTRSDQEGENQLTD